MRNQYIPGAGIELHPTTAALLKRYNHTLFEIAYMVNHTNWKAHISELNNLVNSAERGMRELKAQLPTELQLVYTGNDWDITVSDERWIKGNEKE